MEVADDEWELVGQETHAVAQQARDAGVSVFGGGIDESVAPVRVAGDGTALEGAYPENERLFGGFEQPDEVGDAARSAVRPRPTPCTVPCSWFLRTGGPEPRCPVISDRSPVARLH